jgi:hypothetical protein
MKTKPSLTTNSMKRPADGAISMRRDQVFNPVVEGAMGCGTAYPTCWSGSRARAVSIEPGSRRRKGTGRLWRISELSVLVFVALLFSSQLALAQFSQQAKLVGTGAIGSAAQGDSVSLSSDGNTAIVGGFLDDGEKGAAWVYARTWLTNGTTRIGVWTQQGSKLVGTGAIGSAQQGSSVSLSSNGNTAIVGGPADNGSKGAAWVYTRSGGVWTQQGNKLVDTTAIGHTYWKGFGFSVSLSSDGNTAIVGEPCDDVNYKGAAWVYTRSGGVWTQHGKLVDTGAIGSAWQGFSVSLSSDGNTAIVGGPFNDEWKGAAWVYVMEKQPEELPWWWGYVAIDPIALILKGKALDIWFEIHHPHEPKVAEIQQVLRSMTPEEQKEALNRARTLENYAKAEQKMLRSMTPEALNRARTLENYGKAVKEAFATMKK